jgi:hypothetical protein
MKPLSRSKTEQAEDKNLGDLVNDIQADIYEQINRKKKLMIFKKTLTVQKLVDLVKTDIADCDKEIVGLNKKLIKIGGLRFIPEVSSQADGAFSNPWFHA